MLTETLLKVPVSVNGQSSLVPTSHWLQGKYAKINLSQVAFGMILRNHRRLPVSICMAYEEGYWKDFQN